MAKRKFRNAQPDLVKAEKAYSAAIAPLGTAAIKSTEVLVLRKLGAIVGDPADPKKGWRKRLDRELDKAIKRTWKQYPPRRAAVSVSTARNRVDRLNLGNLTRETRKGTSSKAAAASITADLVTADVSDVAEDWNEAQAGVLTGSVDEHMDRTRTRVVAGVSAAWAISRIQADAREVNGMTRRGLVNSAADWTQRLNGGLSEARWEEANVRRYRWQTVGDELVREEHAARDGQIFAWSNPPSDGHPGEPVNCRCESVPMITSTREKAAAQSGASAQAASEERARRGKSEKAVARFRERELPTLERVIGQRVEQV